MTTALSPQRAVAERHKPGAALSRKERPGPALAPQFAPAAPFFAPAAVQAKCACCEEEQHAAIQAKYASCQQEEDAAAPVQRAQSAVVQAKCAACGEEPHRKEQAETPEVQPATAPATAQAHQPATDFAGGLTVGKPNDRFEREADHMGERVSRMPVSGFSGLIFSPASAPLQRHGKEEAGVQPKLLGAAPALQRKTDGGLHTTSQFTSQVRSSAGGGAALPAPVQQSMSSAFQADFSSVRIHTDTQAAQLSADIGAKAFTHGSDIYFNDNQFDTASTDGRFLLAHELTHTVQQGAALKRTVQPNTAPGIQRDEEPQEKSWWDKLKDVGASALKSILPQKAYNMFVSIQDKGIIGFIKEGIFKLFENLLKGLGFSNAQILLIFQIFATLKDKLPFILQAVRAGDCKPLFEAMDLLSEVVGAIGGRVWDKLMEELEPIRLWLIDLWNTYAAPAIDAVTTFAGDLWNDIKSLGKSVWDWFAPLREGIGDAWAWVVETLGFGSSDEPGLLGVISQKLAAAWSEIKGILKPVIDPVNEMISGIKSLVSLEAIKNLQKDAKEWLDKIAKTATAMGGDDDKLANNQLSLRTVILPALNKSIDNLRKTIQAAGNWVTEKINNIAANVTGFIQGFQASTYLNPLYSVVKWVPDQIENFKDWSDNKVAQLFTDIQAGLESLRKFVEPVVALLEKVVKVLGDLLGHLPDLILGVPWMFLPKCIKDPITKWLTEVVLKQIPIISEFIALTEKWEEIKSAALLVIKQVFLDGQLAKGLWTYFKTLLGLLGIDPKLVTKVIAKAATNFSAIISKPGDFLKNVWTAIKGGFSLFFDHITIHLPKGALDWLFGEVKGASKVAPPKESSTGSISIGSILGYVLDVFGITKDNVYERMRQHPKIGPEKVKRIQQIEKVLTGVLEWLSAWIVEGPEGLLKKIKKDLGDLKTTIINGVVSWVTTRITAEITKKLLTSSDPSGIGAILTTIKTVYDAIKAAVAYVNRILDLVNSVMDSTAEIIAGNTKAASEYLEKVLAKAVPVVVGFAVEAIIGPVGEAIRDIIGAARQKVDEVIDRLINAALGAIEALVQGGKAVVGALVEWWKASKSFTGKDGHHHKLYLEGSENSAELMVASKTTRFADFISAIDVADSSEKKAAKQPAADIAKEIDKKKQSFFAKPKPTKENKEKAYQDHKKEMKDLLTSLSVYVTILLDGKEIPSGKTKSDAIKMAWYKPEGEYKPFSLVDELGKEVTFGFAGAKKWFRIDSEKVNGRRRGTLSVSLGGLVAEKPEPGGVGLFVELGVAADYRIKSKETVYRTGSYRNVFKGRYQQALRLILKSHGMNMNGFDADHVRDLQFGGHDDLDNLWPLNAQINQSSLRFADQVVTYRKDDGAIMAVPLGHEDLKNRWFRVEETKLF